MKALRFSLLAVVTLLLAINADGALTKKVYRSYALNQVKKVQVSNKYGHIYIDDNRNDSVVINVEIKVDGDKKLLDKINVQVDLQGETVVAVTNIGSFTSNMKDLSIDYRISVPANRDLAIDQKYGTVNVKNLTGTGEFNIGYGELTAGKLLSPSLKMDIAYSKANIEETRNLNLALKYSKFFLDKGADMKSETRYSEFSAGEMGDISTDSKYDQYKISSLNILKMSAMYTNTRIDKLNRKLDIDNGYGNLNIDQIPAGFESINVVNKYAGIKLGIATDASYRLDGQVKYCELKHPEGNLNQRRENTSYSVTGTVGKGNSGSEVKIQSQYGNVNLRP